MVSTVINEHIFDILDFINKHYDHHITEANIELVKQVTNKFDEMIDYHGSSCYQIGEHDIEKCKTLQIICDSLPENAENINFQFLKEHITRLKNNYNIIITDEQLQRLRASNMMDLYAKYKMIIEVEKMRLSILQTIFQDRFVISTELPQGLNSEIHNIVSDCLNILHLSERYIYFYSNVNSRKEYVANLITENWQYRIGSFEFTRNYLSSVMVALYYSWQYSLSGNKVLISRAIKHLEFAKKSHKIFQTKISDINYRSRFSRYTSNDDKVRAWVQHKVLQFVDNRLNKKYPDFELVEYVKSNLPKLQKEITKHIFLREHYLAVTEALESENYGVIKKSENKDESKDRTYYGNLKHFFDYINQIYDTQQITFSNICARNDTSGVFRTLSELVKFYLQCIKATTIPALSIGYNDDLLKEALIKHQSIDKDKVYLAQFHFKT